MPRGRKPKDAPSPTGIELTAQLLADDMLTAIKTVCPEHLEAINEETMRLIRARIKNGDSTIKAAKGSQVYET